MDAQDIARKSGIPEAVIREKFGVNRKAIPGPEDTTSHMGIVAAHRALAAAQLKASEIDLVVWCGAQHKDYPCWLAGLSVAHEIGAMRAWSFDMEAMCGSMMVAIDTVKSMMMTKKNLQNVLIVSGYRNGDLINFNETSTSFMFDLGAGGAAVVLQKGYPHNIVLESAFRGDGSFATDCHIPVLGTAHWPPAPDDVHNAYFHVPNPELFKAKLVERTMPNFYAVIRESLNESGLTDDAIDYLAILHFKRSAHEAVLQELGLSPDQTTYLEEYGHVGQNDQILSLELGIQSGKISTGHNVVLVGAGLGFVWAATVIQWG